MQNQVAIVMCNRVGKEGDVTFAGQSVVVDPYRVVPEFLRTLVFARPRGDDQFADCTFSPSLDMSR